jgi:hypothetical protein
MSTTEHGSLSADEAFDALGGVLVALVGAVTL